ncbi:MAG: resolvase [Sphingomonadaceae bacterium MED-G03]|nr:MAG: resolvase [Sphingomonadaceae bacterium MED-G03]
MKAVAYYRVSTAAQGRSGLGLEAQKEAVEAVCSAQGWELISPPFIEVESGRDSDRPELAKAIQRARVTGATLVVAKLDRLSRNAAFLNKLMDGKVPIRFADMPFADRFIVGIMAQVAQWEAEQIGKRTKEALKAARDRGQRLGNPHGAAALRRAGKGNAASLAVVKADAAERAEQLRPFILDMQARGITSLGALARALNDGGFVTARGGQWHASSVKNLVTRLSQAH